MVNVYLHCINAFSFQPAKTASNKSHDNLLQNRRNILKSTATLAAMLSITTATTTSDKALAAQTAGEAVRRSAANLPGYGQPDIYYLSSFIGKWKATRTIISSDDPALLSFILPLTTTCDSRFITVDRDGNTNGKVIADRAFNEASYYNAIRALLEVQQPQLQLQSQLEIRMPASIQSVNWSPFNPNVLNTIYNNAESSKEIKVIKRAAELDDNNSTTTLISSSEYRRVTTTTEGMGIPSISASRLMAK
jgi:hypothetical protein